MGDRDRGLPQSPRPATLAYAVTTNNERDCLRQDGRRGPTNTSTHTSWHTQVHVCAHAHTQRQTEKDERDRDTET